MGVQVKSPTGVDRGPGRDGPGQAEGQRVGRMSLSVAVAVNVSRLPSSTLWLPIGARRGRALTSLTVTVIVSEQSVARAVVGDDARRR